MIDSSRQFPIGPWASLAAYSPADIADLTRQLVTIPAQYRDLTANLTDAELTRRYRPGSWSIRQLVHHVADTHQWHLLRVKHALTEPTPTTAFVGRINDWVQLADAQTAPVSSSLSILDGIHARWAWLAESLTPTDFDRTYYHPGRQLDLSVAQSLHLSVWHGLHHLAHIRLALADEPA